ncbi:MAG TPA: PAS domain S-box protein, partial [Kofleriaceae bacterium]|nr:PAS domain S-box protein [Kofleriaceae bacterium]
MASEELLRRENAELRAREERYREGLQRQIDLSRRLREYAAHLRAQLRDRPPRTMETVFAEVAEVSAGALGVGRVSVWCIDRARRVLRCQHLLVRGEARPLPPELPIGEVEAYVRALTLDLLAVEDTEDDPRLRERRRYCAEHQIGALLDVPIVAEGEVLGVISHEHLGGARRWHDAEIDFAANLGGVVALAIEAERRLEADRRYRQLIDHVDLIGVVLDARGAIEEVNEAFVRAAGVARSEAIGADFAERFVPEADRDRVRAMLAEGIRTRALPARFESALCARDGELHSVVWTSTLLLNGAGGVTGIASLGLDLTDRLRLETELAQQRKFESLGRMAASVAHDFNNVLTVITLAAARGGRGAEIEAAMTYARGLVSSLMSYARRDPVAVADVDVDEALAELEPVLASAVGKDLKLAVELGAAGRR